MNIVFAIPVGLLLAAAILEVAGRFSHRQVYGRCLQEYGDVPSRGVLGMIRSPRDLYTGRIDASSLVSICLPWEGERDVWFTNDGKETGEGIRVIGLAEYQDGDALIVAADDSTRPRSKWRFYGHELRREAGAAAPSDLAR